MNSAEIETALRAAFAECEVAFCSLSDKQKQILLEIVCDRLINNQALEDNPIDELNPKQRQALLSFIRDREQNNVPWKMALFNDWLNNRDSGTVQFIRDKYGFDWLNRIKPVHLKKYFDRERDEIFLQLQVGDRIEVSNSLWEWTKAEAEWFSCVVVGIKEVADDESNYTNCSIRFDNGVEFEIQGLYQWNRYNWRFPENSSK